MAGLADCLGDEREVILGTLLVVLGGLRDWTENEERALHHRSGQRGERRGV